MTMKFSGASGITFPDDTIQDTAARMPPGGIILWSGSTANIPAGWFLCNGQNGTPNLVDKFIVCAGGAYAVNATGGSADAIVVNHTHTLSDPGHSHGVNDPGHNHGSDKYLKYIGGGSSGSGGSIATNAEITVGTTGVTINSGTTGVSIGSAGASGTNANLPPYYALCYIMRG